MPVLEAKGLHKVYSTGEGNEQAVLLDIDLQMRQGEFVAVMGPSGSGKSTLLYAVSGMDKLTAGSVIFNGLDITGLSEDELAGLRLREMGFIFQQMHLLKNLNIIDNIILSAYRAKISNRRTINKRAAELMERTGITALADRDITQVSGGQLQRAAICRALINEPAILLGDEPTGALNSKAAGEIMDILEDIHHTGTTILLATHDAKVAARAERVLYMRDGQIAAEQHLGPYRSGTSDLKKREEMLSSWLSGMGF
ncbi:ABC transporter ATP-binding protein [Paenibacillus radicis (ex Gao et al. 2016)]|uniref:ABC transporter ATP-binding protein n=1 Tax=Paenibacillus radicis (ex Gao et al. 2016) TaxID=1737354 RepID=A0A917LVK9_9BACL|nr:ABC transporter ATP-binding protein [Paenibacillus radicis (ex Gao et al. 2016)]GGG59795.1 ABC transporter ATP-binding protein [Paenibacillus radicis (ex Gao et al. 2016)]